MNEIIESYRVLEAPYTIVYLLSIYSFLLMIPSGIPLITPSGGLIDRMRLVNFAIGALVAILCYAHEFSLFESLFVGTFWPSVIFLYLFPAP